jgi:peptidase A4-like protein
MVMTSRPKKVTPKTQGRGKDQKFGQSLLDRVHELPHLPGAGVDLLRAAPATLARFDLPPRPDPVDEKMAFRIWAYFFGRRAPFVQAGIQLRSASFQLTPGTSMSAPISQSRFETSSNWSGAFVVPTGGDMVLAIMGRWTVPKPKLPPPPERAPGPNAEYACSTWIGLDGQRLYLNSSLPQIGTTQKLTVSASGPPVVSCFGWFQWWERPAGGPFIQFGNFPVTPGDEIASLIWVTGASAVLAAMLNLSTNMLVAVIAIAPKAKPPGGVMRTLTISGATAEWVVERPTIFGSTKPYWFPNYGRTRFRDCRTATGPAPGAPRKGMDLRSPHLIRMYDRLQNPMRTRFISMPEKLSDTQLGIHYGSF